MQQHKILSLSIIQYAPMHLFLTWTQSRLPSSLNKIEYKKRALFTLGPPIKTNYRCLISCETNILRMEPYYASDRTHLEGSRVLLRAALSGMVMSGVTPCKIAGNFDDLVWSTSSYFTTSSPSPCLW